MRKFKIKYAAMNTDGIYVRIGGTYNKSYDEFYDVEQHLR